MASIGIVGDGQHRSGFSRLQQIDQWFLFRSGPLAMLRILHTSLMTGVVTERCTVPAEEDLENNPYYDIERFGIHFVASPRHADALLVTGPVSRHMESALLRTYQATPAPKFVIAAGACACNGGVFGTSYASAGSVDHVIPVDVRIDGCPPSPLNLLQGLQVALNGD